MEVTTTEQRSPFVELRGIVKRYGPVTAVNAADLALYPGEIVGLVGKNGAGKSSIIKILAGASSPDEGSILIGGEPVVFANPHAATRRGLAFVHQELALVPDLSIAENVSLGLGYPRHFGMFVNRRAMFAVAREVLDRLGVSLDPRARVSTLSVAMQRLVMVARGMAQQAKLVVLDEPTASLTDDEIDHLHDVVRSLKDHGVSVVYVSHRVDEILDITDRIVVMRDGSVVEDEPTAAYDKAALVRAISGDLEIPSERERSAMRVRGAEILRAEKLSMPGTVHEVSFAVHAGEIVGLAGLVGAGRTELVRLLFGAERPSGGRIVVQGKPVSIPSPTAALRHGIVLLPEDRRSEGNILEFSIGRNVTLPNLPAHRVAKRVPSPSASLERKSATRLIEQLQIAATGPSQQVATLSGGNQQKVVLAKWLLHGADVFIFDEPTVGVDVGAKAEIYGLVEQLAEEGKAIILISSEFGELVEVCDRVVVMREGRVVGELAGDEISEKAILDRCYAAS